MNTVTIENPVLFTTSTGVEIHQFENVVIGNPGDSGMYKGQTVLCEVLVILKEQPLTSVHLLANPVNDREFFADTKLISKGALIFDSLDVPLYCTNARRESDDWLLEDILESLGYSFDSSNEYASQELKERVKAII